MWAPPGVYGVVKAGVHDGQLVALDAAADRYVVIGDAWNHDLLAFLAGGADAVAQASELIGADGRTAAGPPSGLPFSPRSLRAFALWEAHMVNAARSFVAHFAPAAARMLVDSFERTTRRTFPALRPRPNYYRHPQFYMGNHRSLLADGARVEWPSFSRVLDFELELGVVLAREVRDCSAAEGRAAIGGYTVINDWTARDTQWDDLRRGTFGGVFKAKTFAGAMAATVVTADEVPDWTALRGRVRVNDEIWCEGATASPQHDLGDAIAYAAEGETLSAGDVLATGALPGCCGLELGRWVRPGDVVQIEIDGIGALTNVVGERPIRA